jgi:hypothetical protein
MRKEILMVGVSTTREKKFSWWGNHKIKKEIFMVGEEQNKKRNSLGRGSIKEENKFSWLGRHKTRKEILMVG